LTYYFPPGLGCFDLNPSGIGGEPYFLHWPEFAGLIIGVPLLALAMGFAVSWAISGFSHEPR